MFQGIFGGRAEAYSPGGRGVKDERDIMQKLLEVWGTFQDLKHYAREPLPWEIEIPEEPKAAAVTRPELVRLANFNIVTADVYELAQNAWKNLAEQQFAPYIMKLDLDNMEDAKMKSDLQGVSADFMKVMTVLLQNNPETYKFFP